MYVLPFAAMFGGIAQFLAGMWAFKARDGLACAMHGLWGSFWIAFGVLELIFARGGAAFPARFPELGYWFIVTAAITWVGAWAALAENVSLFLVLVFLALGSTLEAIAKLAAPGALEMAAGYSFIISSLLAFYTASALMLAECYGHPVLSLGKVRNGAEAPVISVGAGEPGVIRGQNLNLAPSESR